MELPQEFLVRMKKMLGDEYEAFLRTYAEPRQFGLRVNTLKISVEEFVKLAPFHLRKIPWTDNGFYYEREDDPARHPFYYAGLYYLQEPSAMLPAAVLPVNPGERVLDLCAAPGGKATALAAKLQGQGLLVANEISASRAKALLKNLEVFGATNSFVTNTTANRLAEQFPEAFDKILVDAPCSGEGMFRKDIANARAWSMEKVRTCAKLQRELMLQAVAMLRPGGLLLYSTCTFAPEEDEGTVAYVLEHCPELELLEIPGREMFSTGRPEYLRMIGEAAEPRNPGGGLSLYTPGETAGLPSLSGCVRIFPHRADGEGHFLALFRKRDGSENGQSSAGAAAAGKQKAAGAAVAGDYKVTGAAVADDQKATGATVAGEQKAAGATAVVGRDGRYVQRKRTGKKPANFRAQGRVNAEEKAALQEFLEDVAVQWDRDKIEVRSGQAYYVPNAVPAGGGLPFLRNGLYLGELRHGRFEPSQSFAMALRADEYASVVNFGQEDIRVRKYLCGETVQVDDLTPARPSGWQLVCICGYPLGWGRLVNGTLKNKYHPGWRMQN